MHTYDRGTNEFYGDEDEVEMTAAEEQQAQEEAHQHFVIKEFDNLITSSGPNTIINQLSCEAIEELSMAFNNLKKGE